jgi:flagellar basal body rod protein FlgG
VGRSVGKTAEVKTRYKISNYKSRREKFRFLFSQQAAGTQKTPPGSRLTGSCFHISRGSAFKQSAAKLSPGRTQKTHWRCQRHNDLGMLISFSFSISTHFFLNWRA